MAIEMFEKTIKAELESETDDKVESILCHTLRDMYGFNSCNFCPLKCAFLVNNSNMFATRRAYLSMVLTELKKRGKISI